MRVEANMAETLRGKKVGRPRKYGDGWESTIANRRICISNKTYEEWKGLKYSSNWRMMIPWHDAYCRVTMIPVGSVMNRLRSYVTMKGNQQYSCCQFARPYFVAKRISCRVCYLHPPLCLPQHHIVELGYNMIWKVINLIGSSNVCEVATSFMLMVYVK